MFDGSLRARNIYLSVSHYLRDWMHVLCCGGVANTHLGLLSHVLVAHGFPLDFISNCIMGYHLPKRYGKVQKT